jgi:hypothetical protein
VRVLVTDRDLRERRGPAFIHDQTEAVSIATAEQHICDTGIVPIHFADDGEPLRLGITRRLFSSKQRDVLAARDGGCRFPDCDRPASWCEAHHRIPWKHGGPTNTADPSTDSSPSHPAASTPPNTPSRCPPDPEQQPGSEDERHRRVGTRAENAIEARLKTQVDNFPEFTHD